MSKLRIVDSGYTKHVVLNLHVRGELAPIDNEAIAVPRINSSMYIYAMMKYTTRDSSPIEYSVEVWYIMISVEVVSCDGHVSETAVRVVISQSEAVYDK